ANAAIGARERTVRYDLYRQFIEEATKLYGDAMVSNKVEVPMLVGAYALISRMRVLSSSDIVDRADAPCEPSFIFIFHQTRPWRSYGRKSTEASSTSCATSAVPRAKSCRHSSIEARPARRRLFCGQRRN